MESKFSQLDYGLSHLYWYDYALHHLKDNVRMNPCCLFTLAFLRIYGASYLDLTNSERHYCKYLCQLGLVQKTNSCEYELSPLGSLFVDEFLPHYKRVYCEQIANMIFKGVIDLLTILGLLMILAMSLPTVITRLHVHNPIIEVAVIIWTMLITDFTSALFIYMINSFPSIHLPRYASRATKSNLIQFVLNHHVDQQILNQDHVQRRARKIDFDYTFNTMLSVSIDRVFVPSFKLTKAKLIRYLWKHSALYQFIVDDHFW